MDKLFLQTIQDGKVKCNYDGITTFPDFNTLKGMATKSKYKFKLNGKVISLKALIETINDAKT